LPLRKRFASLRRCVGVPLKYAGLRVTDLERSLKFYVGQLGLEVERQGSQKGDWVLLRDPRSGQRLELNWYPPGSEFATPYAPGEGLDHLGFEVSDARESYMQLTAAGAPSALAPFSDGPGEWVAYVTDPDGNWVELFSHPPRPEEAHSAGAGRPFAFGFGLALLVVGAILGVLGLAANPDSASVSGFRDPVDAALAQGMLKVFALALQRALFIGAGVLLLVGGLFATYGWVATKRG